MTLKTYTQFIEVQPSNAGMKVGGTSTDEIVVVRSELSSEMADAVNSDSTWTINVGQASDSVTVDSDGNVTINTTADVTPSWVPDNDPNYLTAVPNTYALLASPTFTGTPAAPTAAATDDSTQIATTAHVKDAIERAVLFETDIGNDDPVASDFTTGILFIAQY